MNGVELPTRPYAEALRDEIVRAATRQHRARRFRRGVVKAGAAFVVAAGVVAFVVGVALTPGDGTATADSTVRVTPAEDRTLVEVMIPDRPDDVVDDLRAAGLSVERLERATGPSREGRVLSISVEKGEVTPLDRAGGLAVYVDRGARIVVGVGVPTPSGGFYDAATDAFAAGEPLHCLGWPGQASEALALALAPALDTGTLVVGVIDETRGPLDELPAGRVVRSATALSAASVVVHTGEGAPAPAPEGCPAATAATG